MHPPAECRLFHAGRLLWPGLPLPRPYVAISLAKTLERMQAAGGADSGRFHLSDWWLAKACLWNDPAGREVRERAWGHLMGATLAREGRLLSERLNAKACRAFPSDLATRQETLDEFWGQLLAGQEGEGRLQAYRGTQPLVPWLLTTFRNLCIDKLRRRGRAPVGLDHDDDWPGAPSAFNGSEETSAEVENALGDWLASLSDRQRMLATLRFRHGLNQKGAASALGTTESTVSRDLDRIQEGFTALVDLVDARVEASREAVVEVLHHALLSRLKVAEVHFPAREVANA